MLVANWLKSHKCEEGYQVKSVLGPVFDLSERKVQFQVGKSAQSGLIDRAAQDSSTHGNVPAGDCASRSHHHVLVGIYHCPAVYAEQT